MNDNSSISFSLYDIIKYFTDRWLFYFSGALLGALVALAISIANTTYSATVVLSINRSVEAIPNLSVAGEGHPAPFDLIAWRTMEKRLVDFMQEVASNKNPTNAKLQEIASSMTANWLTNHVSPINFLSTNEGKEILGINSMILGSSRPSEDTQLLKFLGRAIAEATRISSLAVTLSAKNKEEAMAKTDAAADAIINALAILRYRALIDRMAADVMHTDIKLSHELGELKLKMTALEMRRQKLLRLYQEFPSQPTQPVTITDESLSKYLPIPAQLIAIDIDIDRISEELAVLMDKQRKNKLIEAFSSEAHKILSQEFVADNAINQLLSAASVMREKIIESESENIMVIDTLRSQLLLTQTINNNQIKESPAFISQAPTPTKSSIKGAWLGLALALLLSVLISIYKNARPTRTGLS